MTARDMIARALAQWGVGKDAAPRTAQHATDGRAALESDDAT